MSVKLPDEVIQRLLELREESVSNAFEVGRITAEIIDALPPDRGKVGKVVAAVARITGRSPSRIYRFLYLWRAFGQTGVRDQYPNLGLAHWEMAYRIRSNPELLKEFLEIAAQDMTLRAEEALARAKENLGIVEAEPEMGAVFPDDDIAPISVSLMVQRISRGELTVEEVREWLESRPDRKEVMCLLVQVVDSTANIVPMLAEVLDLDEQHREGLEDLAKRLRLYVQLLQQAVELED